MNQIEKIEDFKKFIENNKDIIIKKAVTINELPADDEWLNDDCWEEDYKKGVIVGE